MKKSLKPFLIILIFIFSCINIFQIVNFFMFCTSNDAIELSLVLNIPLLFLLGFYVCISNSDNKIVFNRILLFGSLLSFSILLIYEICYNLLIIKERIAMISLIFEQLFIIFAMLAFIKNFKTEKYTKTIIITILYFFLILPAIFSIYSTFLGIMNLASSSITNPNRYEFVKYHYFSPEEIASLPKTIPDDATNIVFRYYEDILDHSYREIELEFDSNTIKNDNNHAEFHIRIDNEK